MLALPTWSMVASACSTEASDAVGMDASRARVWRSSLITASRDCSKEDDFSLANGSRFRKENLECSQLGDYICLENTVANCRDKKKYSGTQISEPKEKYFQGVIK